MSCAAAINWNSLPELPAARQDGARRTLTPQVVPGPKGGTALNLFVVDMPRLSVNIDLNKVNRGSV